MSLVSLRAVASPSHKSYHRVILYAITGCIAGLFAVVIITGVGNPLFPEFTWALTEA